MSFASCGCDCRVGQNFVHNSDFPSAAPSSSPTLEATEIANQATPIPCLEPSCNRGIERTDFPSPGTSSNQSCPPTSKPTAKQAPPNMAPTSEPIGVVPLSPSVLSSSEPSNQLPTPVTLDPWHVISHEPVPLLSINPTASVSTEPNDSPMISEPSGYPSTIDTTTPATFPSTNPRGDCSFLPSNGFHHLPSAMESPGPTAYPSKTPTTSQTQKSKEPSAYTGSTFWPSIPWMITWPSKDPTSSLSSAPSPTTNKASAAPTEISRVPNTLDSPSPHPIASTYSPSSDASSFPTCEDICSGWVQKHCVRIDTNGHPTDEQCVIGDEWNLLFERFVSAGLPIDEQIRLRSLVIAAFETSEARIFAGLNL